MECISKNDGNNRYRDYFIEQYSKYDENNPEHFQIIASITRSFLLNLDKFRLNILYFECYRIFKEKMSDIFEKLEEDQLRIDKMEKTFVNL